MAAKILVAVNMDSMTYGFDDHVGFGHADGGGDCG